MSIGKSKGQSRHRTAPHIGACRHSKPAGPPQGPTITISLEPFGCGFDVGLKAPADGDRREREFRDHPATLAYAQLLRLELGGTIVDHCGAVT